MRNAAMRTCAEQPVVLKENCYDRRTNTSFDRWQFYSVVSGAWVLRQPVLVPLHGFCRPESVSVWIHELVPYDDHPAQSWSRQIGKEPCPLRWTEHPHRNCGQSDARRQFLSGKNSVLPRAIAFGLPPRESGLDPGDLISHRVSEHAAGIRFRKPFKQDTISLLAHAGKHLLGRTSWYPGI